MFIDLSIVKRNMIKNNITILVYLEYLVQFERLIIM